MNTSCTASSTSASATPSDRMVRQTKSKCWRKTSANSGTLARAWSGARARTRDKSAVTTPLVFPASKIRHIHRDAHLELRTEPWQGVHPAALGQQKLVPDQRADRSHAGERAQPARRRELRPRQHFARQ